MSDRQSFFTKLGRRFGENARGMYDPTSPGNRNAAKAREAVKQAFTDFTTGFSGDARQRQSGDAGGTAAAKSNFINTGLKKPDEYKRGRGIFAADPGTTNDDVVAPYKKAVLGAYDKIRNAPQGNLIGSGTPDYPYTGTRSRPSGFGEQTAEDAAIYAENTGNGKYLGGMGEKAGLANAAYDLYHDQQMRQVAENDKGLDNYLAYIANKKQERSLNKDKVRMRHLRSRDKINSRRYAEFMTDAQERQSAMADAALEPRRIAASELAAGSQFATADAAKARAAASIYDTDADRYKTDIEAATKLSLGQIEDDQATAARFTSPADIDKIIGKVIANQDMPTQLTSDPDFMEALRYHVSRGGNPLELANAWTANGMARPLGKVEGV
jgi:hypothetical protein